MGGGRVRPPTLGLQRPPPWCGNRGPPSRDLASRRSDALSLAADLSTTTKNDDGNLGGNVVWPRPAGLPATTRRKKKRVGAREPREARGDPRRARLVASGGREVPPEGRTRSLRRWLRPPVLAAAAGPGTHGAGLKEVDRFYSSLRLDLEVDLKDKRAGGERDWSDDRGDDSWIVAERYGF